MNLLNYVFRKIKQQISEQYFQPWIFSETNKALEVVLMSLGCCLEERAFTTDFNTEYAYKMDHVVSDGEETGVLSQIGEVEKSGYQLAKAAQLIKVENEWDKLMYKSALDWKQKTYPEEVQKRLTDAADPCLEPKGKWISFLGFEKEWNM